MPEQKEITVIGVNDKNPFSSDAQTVNHSPDRFEIDFKSIHSEFVPGDAQNRVMVVNHNIIFISPFVAKGLLGVLNQNIKNYEGKYGEIKKPESLEKAEKDIAEQVRKQKATSTLDRVSYVG